jgi:TonB family protein
MFACEVPTYSSRGAADAELTRRQAALVATPATPQPAPIVPNVTPGVAKPAPQPFDSIECDVPFMQARVVRPVQPDYPREAMSDGQPRAVEVEVAIDERGQLIDAWVFARSGDVLVDLSAVRAARRSSYSPATSYCQKVKGYYLFRADFRPD